MYDEFVRTLKEKTEKLKVGDPLDRDVYLGPVIDEGAVATFEEAVERGQEERHGGRRAASGSPRASSRRGTFVQPTVAEVPLDSWIWKKELFVPFVAVAPYDDLDEAIRWPTTPSTA